MTRSEKTVHLLKKFQIAVGAPKVILAKEFFWSRNGISIFSLQFEQISAVNILAMAAPASRDSELNCAQTLKSAAG